MHCCCCSLLFQKHSRSTRFPRHPIFYRPFEYYLLFLMDLGRGEGEGQYGRDVKHEPENMLALNCHHTAVGRSEPEKLATNTHTQTHARHTPRRSRGVCEQPRSSYLGCLGSLCSQCTTLSSLSPIFPHCGEQRGRCRCCGGVTVQAGDSRQLAAASAAGLWLLPGLLLLMMMPRRRRAE